MLVFGQVVLISKLDYVKNACKRYEFKHWLIYAMAISPMFNLVFI